MIENLNIKDKAKVTAAAIGLGVFALGGCSMGPDNELSACPKGWRTDLEVDAGVAVGVLGAIGEKADSNIGIGRVAEDVESVFTDNGGLANGRINSDQIDEVVCETEAGEVVLNANGSKLVAVAAMNNIELGALRPIGEQLMKEQGTASNPSPQAG